MSQVSPSCSCALFEVACCLPDRQGFCSEGGVPHASSLQQFTNTPPALIFVIFQSSACCKCDRAGDEGGGACPQGWRQHCWSCTSHCGTGHRDPLLAGLVAALLDAGRALDAAGVAGLEAANSARLPGLLAGWAAKPVPSWPHR